MSRITLQAGYRTTLAGGWIRTTNDKPGHPDVQLDVPEGLEFLTLEDLVAYLHAELDPGQLEVELVVDEPCGHVKITDAEGYDFSVHVLEEGLAAFLGWPTSQSGESSYTGAAVPAFWQGGVLRDWGYSLQLEQPKIAGPLGSVLSQGLEELDTLTLWASVEALADAEQVYRLIWYVRDGLVLRDDRGRVFLHAQQPEVGAVLDNSDPDQTVIELELVSAAGVTGVHS